MTVFINPAPVVDLGNNITISPEDIIVLDAGEGFVSYLWNDNSTNQTLTVDGSVLGEGIFTYFVEVTDENGCTGSDTIVVTITTCTMPSANFSISDTSICAGETVYFTDLSTEVEVDATYQWDIDSDGTTDYTTTGDISHIYNSAGFYEVKLTISQGGSCTDSIVKSLSVYELPVANFGYTTDSLTVYFHDSSMYASTYLWDFGDGTTADSANPVHIYETLDSYTVTLIVSNNCGNTMIIQQIAVTSISDVVSDNLINIYPNPTTGIFNVVVKNFGDDDFSIQIIDVRGQIIYCQNNITSDIEQIDLNYVAKGVYFILIKSNEYVITKKLIIEWKQ